MSEELVMGHAAIVAPAGATIERFQPSVGTMLQSAIASGVTAENVAVLEKLMDLYERDQARQAEREYTRAFVALQVDMPDIRASSIVPLKNGGVKFRYEKLENLLPQVRPLLLKHGFAISFDTRADGERVTGFCTLQHVAGHSRTSQSTVRVGRGPHDASETQADGSAQSYAQRYAFCDIMGITIKTDTGGEPTDARVEGGPISADKVQYLREQLREAGGSEAGILAMAGVATLEEVGDAIYPVLVRALEMKKRAKK